MVRMEVDQVDCLWSLILLLVNFFKVLRKAISTMPLCSNSSNQLSLKRISEQTTTTTSELASKSNCKVKVHPVGDEESSPAPSPEKVLQEGVVDDESLEKKGVDSLPVTVGKKMALKARMRPAMIAIPESVVSLGFGDEVEKEKDLGEKEVEVEESEYCLVSRKGKRHVMEDGYGVITNIHGDSNQAFFGVFDGHGGRAAVDFISEKLGNNIITALSASKKGEEEEDPLEVAIKEGYLTTDREFLSKGVSSGACVATVMFKDGEMHVANVGDCRVVMSKKGIANALTSDHHPGREDERIRIENSGGYVSCRNGVWRVQDSLAVSRAIGDNNMKEWVISEPETNKLKLTSECEFLIVASDGLWDKVSNQEAVDVVMKKKKNSVSSCKELVELSSRRGGRDDITVMVIDLERFM